MWRRHSSFAGPIVAAALVAACKGSSPRLDAPDASSASAGRESDASSATSASAASVYVAQALASKKQQADASVDTPSADLWAFDCKASFAPRSSKSVGHTSVVFKLELSNGKKVAWKPNAKRVSGRYKGEVAAFRLAGALGIVNVLPACARVFEQTEIAAALAPNATAAKLLADEAIVENGKIHGAIIPWVDDLQFWPLEKEPLRTEAKGWLTAGSEVPTAKADLARQTSTLVSFDFITGNWDRYSGENVGIDKAGTRVLYLDNDAAFMEAVSNEQLARNKALLQSTDRFSRKVIASIRALDEARLAQVFGDDTPGRPLLSRSVIRTVARRMKELLAVVNAKIAAHGEGETLYFP